MGRRVKLIGQAYGRAWCHNPKIQAFDNVTGARLADLLGVTLPEMLEVLQPENLIDHYIISDHLTACGVCKGRAADRARQILRDNPETDLLLAGRWVSEVFSRLSWIDRDEPFLRWLPYLHRFVCIIPHPSGINRWWNDPRNLEDARMMLRSLDITRKS